MLFPQVWFACIFFHMVHRSRIDVVYCITFGALTPSTKWGLD